jgi:DNA-binding transcriptional ArsR family regulator
MIVETSNESVREDMLARVYHALGEPTRLRILRLLVEHDGLSCGEVGERLGVNCSTLSHHLTLLHDAGLIGRHKQGTFRILRVHREVIDRFAPAAL